MSERQGEVHGMETPMDRTRKSRSDGEAKKQRRWERMKIKNDDDVWIQIALLQWAIPQLVGGEGPRYTPGAIGVVGRAKRETVARREGTPSMTATDSDSVSVSCRFALWRRLLCLGQGSPTATASARGCADPLILSCACSWCIYRDLHCSC